MRYYLHSRYVLGYHYGFTFGLLVCKASGYLPWPWWACFIALSLHFIARGILQVVDSRKASRQVVEWQPPAKPEVIAEWLAQQEIDSRSMPGVKSITFEPED